MLTGRASGGRSSVGVARALLLLVDERGVDGGVSIRVRDSGTGIAKADIAKVLADYGQATNPEVRKHGGTGLGLPIVSALMALHGGSLELESELGQGTSVSLNFPAARSLCRGLNALAA